MTAPSSTAAAKAEQKTEPVQALSLWWTAPGLAEVSALSSSVAGGLDVGPDAIYLTTLCTGLSQGTERIVGLGHVPESLWTVMACPHQRGGFGFPICYGYSLVGVDESGRRWHALHPHSTGARVAPGWLTEVPVDVPSERATLLPNVETALNAVWAGEVLPGDRCAVVGGGVVGLAVAKIAQAASGIPVSVVEPVCGKRSVAEGWGCEATDPSDAVAMGKLDGAFDVVFHTSGTEAGLRSALSLGADDAPIVEVSWYGDQEPSAPLGREFHYRRLRLVSAQVANVPPQRRARWSTLRRREHAMQLLRDPSWHALIQQRIAFEDAAAWLQEHISDATFLHTVFEFASADDDTNT
ncbi:MAG: hypothetical protein ACI81R_002757 [Bradymonadia bacterium]|jgi:hypothetical protein